MKFRLNFVKLGLALVMIVGGKIYLAWDHKVKDEALTANAHNYVAFTKTEKQNCETELGLSNTQCHCLFNVASRYAPTNPQDLMPTFAGDWAMSGAEILAIPETATVHAMYDGKLNSNLSRMKDGEGEDMSSREENELLDMLVDTLRENTYRKVAGACVSDTQISDLAHRDYYKFERYMSQSWKVKARRTELIATGKLSPVEAQPDVTRTAAAPPSAESESVVEISPKPETQDTAEVPALRGLRTD